MGIRIDTCWNGKAAPFSITQAATTVEIGLTVDKDGWYACMEVVASRLEAVLQAAFPAGSWAVYWTASTGKLLFDSGVSFNASLQAGFAAWASLSTSYTAVNEMESSAHLPYVYDDQWVEATLPIRVWHRELAGQRAPAVWTSHWAWDLRWTRRYTDELTIPQLRSPFALYLGDSDSWALDDRDGYIVGRPLDQNLQRGLLSQETSQHGTWDMRCIWLNPTL